MKSPAKRIAKPADPVLEIEDLRMRLEEAEETLRAIRRGEVDGLIIDNGKGRQVYTLKGADESYRTLVEAMAEGALIVGRDDVILYANKRFASIVGTPLPKVFGGYARDYVPADLRPVYADLVAKSAASGTQQELVLRRPDKTLVPVQLSASRIMVDETVCTGILVTDLTEHKERETARAAERLRSEDEVRRHAAILETTNLQLQTSNRELEAFVYSVSHDLRAPLRSIHRFAALIREDYETALDPPAKDYLGRITDAAVRMDDLIHALLSYSRVSRQEIKLHALDTTSVVSEVIHQMADEIREAKAEVQVDTPLPPAVGDPLLLSQAMTNLVSNAIKFVPPQLTPKVRIRSETLGSIVRLWVEDNGIGISLAEQTRLFRLFERLHQQFKGTGIGLAIVRRAMERMSGTVGVQSVPGVGSKFWVDLHNPGWTGP
jgi:PAS domain S-box-containing protein